MKSLKYLFLVLVSAISLMACKSDKKAEETLRQEVERLHDEVMPKTDRLYKLRKDIEKAYPDSVKVSSKASSISANLIKAEDAMMDWMHDYKADPQGSHAEIMTYLEGEKQKVINIKTLYQQSIEQAEHFLSK